MAFGVSGTRNWLGAGRRAWIKALVLLVIVALVAALAWIYNDYKEVKDERDRLANPTESAKAATSELIAKVGKLTQLPQGETPTVATVTDASKLKSQSFFARAENGDRVLIYVKAKQAYLYRPSTDKIIQIAPINIGDGQSTTPAPTPSPTTPRR
jgi:hypothetical protein